MLEDEVVLLELFLFFGRKPIACSVRKFLFQLCIDLLVLNAGTINFILYLYTEKTAAAGVVGQ